MAEFPALPLWTDAYLGDTTHLTTIEHGCYLLLLMAQWRSKECRLPDNDVLLAKYTRMTPAQWRRTRPIMESFFKIENGCWTQLRLVDELNVVRRKSKTNSENAHARWLKIKETGNADASNSQCERNAPTPTPNPHPQPQGESPLTPHEKKQVGDFLNGFGKGGFEILSVITNDALMDARAAAPGWDINELARRYNEGRKDRGYPKNPNKAFPAWCKNYTKGHKP